MAGRLFAAWPADSGTYTYDPSGNITNVGDDHYEYDRFGRLTNATAKTAEYPTNAQIFTYDRYGNMTTMTTSGGLQRFTEFAVVPATNRVSGPCTSPSCVRAEYDDAGNEIGRYQWDAAGMMTEANLTGRQEQYVYDANDERIATVSLSAQTTLYTLRGPGNEVDREFTHDDTQAGLWKWSKDYVYRGGKLFAAWVAGETQMEPTRHYHDDHLGTARLITDGQGYKLSEHTYFPFGSEASGSDYTSSERLRFTGHERDSDHVHGDENLDYMHARFYRAEWGRFLSVDPAWSSADIGKPQTWNRYDYVRNTPLTLIDPDGRASGIVMQLFWSVFRREHVRENHVNKQLNPGKSKFIDNNPKNAEKLIQKTVREQNYVKTQPDGRKVYERTFNKPVGTEGETTVRAVTEPVTKNTEAVVTGFPTLETLADVISVAMFADMALNIYAYSKEFEKTYGRAPSLGETSHYLTTGDKRSYQQMDHDLFLQKHDS